MEAPPSHRIALCRRRRQNPVRISARRASGSSLTSGEGEIYSPKAKFRKSGAQSATRLRKRSVAESGSHIRLSERCPLARHRERRDIFAKGEIPGIAHKENHALSPQAAESGSHSPLLCSGRPMVAPTVKKRFYKKILSISCTPPQTVL